MDAARSANAPGGTVIHAKGTGAEHAKRFLGISLAEEKEMIFIVVKTSQKQAIMKSIMERAGIGSPAGGIVFSLPSPALRDSVFRKPMIKFPHNYGKAAWTEIPFCPALCCNL